MRGTEGFDSSYVHTEIMKQVKSEEEGKSYALRLLIHYMGDIHQPLHCMNRVDADFPVGDRGGNEFPLPDHYEANNLHSVWDSVMYEFHESMKMPFTSEAWTEVGGYVDILTSEYDVDAKQVNSEDYSQWGQDSYKIGTENAYKNVE